MTLTLTETLDRIRKLDTDPDIIRNACWDYIKEYNQTGEFKFDDPETEEIQGAWERIIRDFMANSTPKKALKTLATCASVIIFTTVRSKDKEKLKLAADQYCDTIQAYLLSMGDLEPNFLASLKDSNRRL